MAQPSQFTAVLRTIRAELSPYPDRLAGSLRDTLGILIALVIAMTLRVPGISLALALLFLTQRERPGLTLRSGVQIVGGAVAALALSFVWVQATDSAEVARFLGIVLGIFFAAFCMTATTIPLFFTIFGFYWFLDLSSWDIHHTPDAIVTSGLNNIASLAIVMACAAGVGFLFSTSHPGEELEEEMQRRLNAMTQFFRLMAKEPTPASLTQLRTLHHTIVQYAHSGDRRLNELYDELSDSNPDLSRVPIGLHYRIGLLSRLLEKTAVLGFSNQHSAADRSCYAVLAVLREPIDGETSHDLPACEPLMSEAPGRLRAIDAEFRQYLDSRQAPSETPIKPVPRLSTSASLFLPGVFDQPDSVVYALKLTLAATLCYIFYSAVAWPGILTCVVTVLFTGLTSTGAMKQKQIYRFVGAAIGGAIGIATVSLLFPNMDSITSLVLVVGCVSVLSAWVLRSPRMSYVGVQIGFAFFLTTLPGFTPATMISPARDRLIGIAIGILVMWFIFDQLWPVRTSTALEITLKKIRSSAMQLHAIADRHPLITTEQTMLRLRVAVSRELANVQVLESAAHFDFGRGHTRELARSRRLIRQIEAAAAEFYAEILSRSDQVSLPK